MFLFAEGCLKNAALKKQLPVRKILKIKKFFCMCNIVTEKIRNSGYTVNIKRMKTPKEEKTMAVEKITDSNFEEKVLNFKGTVLLDFWATWCGPCRMMSPVVDEIAAEHPEILVGKVNVDEEEALSARFKIFSIPTFIVLKDGKVQAQTAGARPKSALESLL